MAKKIHPWILLVCTGAGNTVQGGADIWVNNFIKEVWSKLPNKSRYRLLIDSKRPNNFKPTSLPPNLKYHFHHDDPSITQKWGAESKWVHFLHPHYHYREHLWEFEENFGICFVHAYPKDMRAVEKQLPELTRLQFQTKVDEKFYGEFLLTCKKRIWIGLNKSQLLDDFPNYTDVIANYYEFSGPAQLTTRVDNGEVGFAARAETRKCLHWMNGIKKGYALTGQHDVKNLKDTTTFTLPNVDLFQWDPGIYKAFMGKDWGIFHGASFKEPFGYNIFQSVDYGKLPIINKDWAPSVDYKYRVNTKNEFDACIKQMVRDSHETRVIERNKLIDYMKRFDNKEQWVDAVTTQILSFW
ncbi:MAG: hypothetical protein ACKVGT_10610 [Flavobacteriales bacterium]|jgi:hypothetical protein|tara:strand:- start:70 stop:1131 length:1062 start_codon:yes stop_codon:yes gene_type:complete